jgi:hypothetical protein
MYLSAVSGEAAVLGDVAVLVQVLALELPRASGSASALFQATRTNKLYCH